MNAFKFFDAYSMRARLFPAILASASVFVAICVLMPWNQISIAQVVGSIAIPVILFAMADIARRIGKRREPRLYEKWGGMPTTRMMRHADMSLDADTKAAYLGFVAGKLNASVPSAQEEAASPKKADAFYARCATWLRENTRDTKKFTILFDENIAYGYRRNLFALKYPVLGIDAMIVIGALIYLNVHPTTESEAQLKIYILIGVAILHAAYFSFVATENSVREAANTYARQLLLSCESLAGPSVKVRKRAAAKATPTGQGGGSAVVK